VTESRNTSLADLKNIGKKIAERLNEAGIFSEDDLGHLGAVGAHRLIKEKIRMRLCRFVTTCIHSKGRYLTSIGMRSVSKESSNSEHKSANKALPRTATPLRFIAAGEL